MRPNDRRYIESHEWCQIRDRVAKFGLTDFAIENLADLVFIDLPEPGKWLPCGIPFGELETTQGVFNLIAPLGGELLEVNDEVVDHPESLRADPFGTWLVRVKIGGRQMDMMDSEAYEQHCLKAEKIQ